MRPEISIPAGLATAALVYAIFENATPTIADIRVTPPNDQHIAASERLASWTAAGTVAAVSLIAKDPNIFIFGGAAVIALAWWHRHANAFNPAAGRLGTMADVSPMPIIPASGDMAEAMS